MNISLEVEIPESLHEAFLAFLDSRADWDQDRVMSAAIALFMLNNRPLDSRGEKTEEERLLARTYLDSLFMRPVLESDAA